LERPSCRHTYLRRTSRPIPLLTGHHLTVRSHGEHQQHLLTPRFHRPLPKSHGVPIARYLDLTSTRPFTFKVPVQFAVRRISKSTCMIRSSSTYNRRRHPSLSLLAYETDNFRAFESLPSSYADAMGMACIPYSPHPIHRDSSPIMAPIKDEGECFLH
jgi:hypothetical protein